MTRCRLLCAGVIVTCAAAAVPAVAWPVPQGSGTAASPAAATPQPGAVDLFNGTDLSGWVNVNCALSTWTVRKDEKGEPYILCSGVPTGVLRTEKAYENFILDMEWMHEQEPGNAGLFVWSDPICARGVPFTRSVEVQVMLTPDYVDDQGRTLYTGQGDIFSIHGARMTPERPHPAGWERCLPSERRTKGAGEWNHYRVTCRDGTIALEVNGAKVSGGTGITPRAGYICLESEGTPIRFRRIRIQELPPAEPAIPAGQRAAADEGFRALFDGTLGGWEERGGGIAPPAADAKGSAPAADAAHWTVRDWVLAFDGKGKDLWSQRSFKDFEMIVDWRWVGDHQGEMQRPHFGADGTEARNPDGSVRTATVGERDSGIYLRGSTKSQVNMWMWPCGSGEVWGYRTDAKMPAEVRAACTPKVAADAPVGQWNRFRIRMKGDVLDVWLNGTRVIEAATLPGVPAEGPIGLQSHGSAAEFANIYVRELPSVQ
jgi:hypothetical protein